MYFTSLIKHQEIIIAKGIFRLNVLSTLAFFIIDHIVHLFNSKLDVISHHDIYRLHNTKIKYFISVYWFEFLNYYYKMRWADGNNEVHVIDEFR